MKSSSPSNPQKGSPLINLAIIIVLLLTALPIVLFALYQINPPSFGKPAATVQADTAKHSTAAERRAEREEARKETEAAAAAAAKNPAPVITTTTVPAPGGFGPGGMGGFGGPGMEFGGPGGMGGFGGF